MIGEKIFEHEDEDGDVVEVTDTLSRLEGKRVILLRNDPLSAESSVAVRLHPEQVRGLLNALAGWLAKNDTPSILGFREKFVQDEVIVSVPENEADIRLEALRLAVQVVPATRDVALRATETATEFEAYLRGTQ